MLQGLGLHRRLLILLAGGCAPLGGCLVQKHSEVLEKSGYIHIKPDPSHIDSPEVIDWQVGPLHRKTVTKGISFRVNFPRIPRDYFSRLITDYKIDSWIVDVRRRTSGSTKSLQRFYVPIVNDTSLALGGSSYKVRPRKDIIARIYYADAAVSKRFEEFHCPALGHNLVIRDVDLLRRRPFGRSITIASKRGKPFNQKIHQYAGSRSVVNGGKSLTGEYSASIAFYNYKDRKIMSNFHDLKNVVRASSETHSVVQGCANFRIPAEKPHSFPIKGIFGRGR